MVKKVTSKTKLKKKRWIPVLAPKIFNHKQIGETYVLDPETKVGKVMTANLMTLTGDIKSQNSEVQFIITKLSDGTLNTRIIKSILLPSGIKRIVRRRQDRQDEILKVKTKDGQEIRLKTILVTRSRTTGSVLSGIRAKAKELVIEYVQKNNYEDIFRQVIFHHMQKDIKSKLSKIYPLKIFDIRVIERASKDLELPEEKLSERKPIKKPVEKKVIKKKPDEESPKKEDKEG